MSTLETPTLTVAELALLAHDNGMAVVPPRQDGSKAPVGYWTEYQTVRPTREQVEQWYANPNRAGVGIVGGAVSGGLELFEFEGRAVDAGLFDRFITDAAEDPVLDELVNRIIGGWWETSPSGGVHLYYRCAETGNVKLAKDTAKKDLMETKGEGGYMIVAPSGGPVHPTGRSWVLGGGGPATVATITPDERHQLLEHARRYDERDVPTEDTVPTTEDTVPTDFEERPLARSTGPSWVSAVVEDYNRRTTWAQVLGGHFEHVHDHGGIGYWHYVGADNQISATTNAKGTDTLIVFSGSAQGAGWEIYESGGLAPSYDRFAAHVQIVTGASDTASRVSVARELRAGGYGPPDGQMAPPPVDPETGEIIGPKVPVSFDDAHVADALAHRLRGEWLYVAAWGRWLCWDGKRWAHDETEQAFELARQWVIELGEYLFRAGASSDDVKRAAALRSRGRLEAVLTMARRIEGIAAAPGEFDNDPDMLNVNNGVVDLRTGEIHPHDPRRRITKLAPVDFLAGATHPDLNTLFGAVPDDVVPWLQKAMGYAATGHTSEDVALVLDGAGGNAKSTVLEGIGGVLGDYAGAVSPQLVMRTSHEPHPTIKADLMGKRLVWVSETEEGGSFRMEQVKALTGGDQISARFMRGDFFTFTPSHTLVVATNHRPNVNSTEYAAWRRLRLVPFPHTYRPAHEAGPGDRVQDPGLRRRLATGTEQRRALLAWIVAGAVEWNRSGLGVCPSVETATRQWRQAEDVILRFINDCIEFTPDESTRGAVLYEAYKVWTATEGRGRARSNKNFVQEFMGHEAVKAAGVTKVDRQRVAFYEGIGVRVVPNF